MEASETRFVRAGALGKVFAADLVFHSAYGPAPLAAHRRCTAQHQASSEAAAEGRTRLVGRVHGAVVESLDGVKQAEEDLSSGFPYGGWTVTCGTSPCSSLGRLFEAEKIETQIEQAYGTAELK
jgi:hypothetical protein